MQAQDQQRLVAALEFALASHGSQTRKGRDIPYVSHLLQVGGLVFENGGGVDDAIAGLLHDVVEDCDEVDVAAVRKRFGDHVAEIVQACSDIGPDDTSDQKSPWLERKRRYLGQLAEAGKGACLVAACDKVDNLRSLVADLHREGPATLERFSATPRQTRWYYESIRDCLHGRAPERILVALDALLDELRSYVPEASPDP